MESNPVSEQPTVQQSPIQPISQANSSGSKLRPVLLVILLLVIVGVGAYLLGTKQNILVAQNQQKAIAPTISQPTPTPDPTVNWKTFTSVKYGYTLKYPTTLVATEFLTPFYSVMFKAANAKQGDFPAFSLLASPDTFIAKSPAAYDYLSADVITSLTNLATNATKQMGTVVFTKLPDTIVAGQSAIAVTVTATDDNTNQKRIIVKSDGNIYMFVNDSNDPNFDNFLSTFKFTSQALTATPTPPTYEITQGNLVNTYTNNIYNFSFNFPKSLFISNNQISAEYVGFLEKQDNLNAIRMSVNIYKNATLDGIVTKYDLANRFNQSFNLEKTTISGKEALLVAGDKSMRQLCNLDDDQLRRVVLTVLVKGSGFVLEIDRNDTCDTLQTNWFDSILNSITLN
jgi:hypothetical protein